MGTFAHLADVYVPRLLQMLFAGLILGLVWWLINMIPLPAPYKNVIVVVFTIIAVLILLSILIGGRSFLL